MNIRIPTLSELSAFGRHVVSYAMGAATAGVAIHFLTPDQGSQITAGIGSIVSGVNSIVGGAATLIAVFSGLYAAYTASSTKQAAAIGANPSTIVNAAPGGKATVTINDPAMAAAALQAQRKSS